VPRFRCCHEMFLAIRADTAQGHHSVAP
jgi:hypothetical protein